MNNSYRFDKEKHIHYINGIQVPGVTGILKAEGFINFPDGVFMNDAKYRGNFVHTACHYFNQGCLDFSSILPEFKGYIEAWIKFCNQEKIIKPASEMNIYSFRWGYAGILDALDTERLIDIKTSKTKSPSWKYQTAGYQVAYEEMTGKKIKERLVVQLSKEGEYKIEFHKDKSDIQNFLSILTTNKLKIRDKILSPEGEFNE